MTADQINHCAQVALYTKIHAVRLMQAGDSAQDLAGLFLDLFFGIDFTRESFATPQDAEDLLTLVASGYDRDWARQRRFEDPPPDTAKRIDIKAAMLDLSKTSWLWRVCECLRDGTPEDAVPVATRFLFLREHIRALTRQTRIYRHDGTLLVRTMCQFILDQKDREERTQHHGKLHYLPTHRRIGRRTGSRGLGL